MYSNPEGFPVITLTTPFGPAGLMVMGLESDRDNWNAAPKRHLAIHLDNFKVNGKTYAKFILDFYIKAREDGEGYSLGVDDRRIFTAGAGGTLNTATMTDNAREKVTEGLKAAFWDFQKGREWVPTVSEAEAVQRRQIEALAAASIASLEAKIQEVRDLAARAHTAPNPHEILETLRRI